MPKTLPQEPGVLIRETGVIFAVDHLTKSALQSQLYERAATQRGLHRVALIHVGAKEACLQSAIALAVSIGIAQPWHPII